jgi:hypothetical protein
VNLIIKIVEREGLRNMRKYKLFQFLFIMCFSFVVLIACTNTKDSTDDTNQTSEPVEETVGAPTHLTVTDGILTWDAVTGANEYVITIDGVNYSVTNNRFNLNELDLDGEFEIKVKAVKGEQESTIVALSHVFVSLEELKDDVYLMALSFINESYTADMQASDFDYPGDYDIYLRISRMARVFAESSVNVSLTEEEINHAVDVVEAFTIDLEGESLADLAPVFDILEELNLSAYEMAYIMTHLAEEFIAIYLEEYNGEMDVIVINDNKSASGVVAEEIEESVVDDQASVTESGVDEVDPVTPTPSFDVEALIGRLEAVQTLLEEDKDAFIDGLEVVIHYLLHVSGEIDANWLQNMDDTINNPEFSLTEIFVLKNEVMAVLEETLPSVDDFEKLYALSTLLSHVVLSEEESTVDYTALIHAQAVSTHYSNKLMIQFIKAVDETTYNEVQALIANLVITEEFDYYTTQTVDVEVAVDLFFYVDQYIRDFIADHQADFDQLKTVQNDETVKALMYDQMEESIIESIELTYDQYEMTLSKETLIQMVNNIFDHIDLYEDLNELSEEIGWNLYDQLITTEAQIIIDFYHLTQSDISDETFPVDAQAIFTQFITYQELAQGSLTQADFNLIGEAIYEIIKFPVMEGTGYTEAEMETISTKILPVLAESLYTLNEFELELMKTLNTQGSIESIFGSNNSLTEDERLVAELIIALDTNLTDAKQTELKVLITRVFDEVLLDAELVSLFGFDPTLVEDSKTNTLTMFDELVLQIETMATYDFDQLTDEQYQELLDLKAFILMY